MSQLQPTTAAAGASEPNPEILARCEKRITALHATLQNGERINEGMRFLIGAAMIVAKPHVPHGNSDKADGFGEWCESKFKIEPRTAQNWMKFATAMFHAAQGRQLKSETVSLFKQLPDRLADGGIDDKQRAEIIDLVPVITKGVPMMDFIRQNSENGGSRQITFHCPHCATEN